eukprot:6865402-Prymnesium_polylepis.1
MVLGRCRIKLRDFCVEPLGIFAPKDADAAPHNVHASTCAAALCWGRLLPVGQLGDCACQERH